MATQQKLEERIAELEAEVAWLKGDGPLTTDEELMKTKGKFTGREWQFMILMIRREFLHRDAAYAAIYGDRDIHMKIFDTFVEKIRRKLTPLGVTITTVWGRGWVLTAHQRNLLLERLKSE